MAKQKGETSQGLVVTLVFFILTTIVLGVTTWLGYSTQQEQLDKDLKQAKTDLLVARASSDWFEFQALTYRAAMGQLKASDALESKRRSFLNGELGKNATDREEVKNLILNTLEDPKGGKGFTYDEATKQYKNSYEGLLVKKENEITTVMKENANLQTRIAGLETAKTQLNDQLTKQKTDFDAALAKLGKENIENKEQRDTARDQLIAEVKRLTEANAALLLTSAEKEKKLTADYKKALDQLGDQKRQLTLVNEELLSLKSRTTEATDKPLRTDWKIATIQGNLPYINLGSADNVKAQLTFNIHGVGPDGRPTKEAKGTLEVVNVIGPHLSQARITEVKDPNRDPVLVGDVLNNSTWNPFQKRHVAIAGYIDLYGDGRDSMAELKRTLERQNVIVDAYLDLKDFTIQGALTLQTDYLILGDGEASLPFSVRERDGFGKKLTKGIEEIQAEAKKNGVPVIGLRKYLDSIGYKMPRPVSSTP